VDIVGVVSNIIQVGGVSGDKNALNYFGNEEYV